MAGNPIQYTSRTFVSILNDINSDDDLVDKPDFFKRMISGIGEVNALNLNAVANQSMLRTAITRQATANHLEQIDFQIASHSTSSGTIRYEINGTASLPFTLLKADQVSNSTGSLVVSSKRFEGRSDISVTLVTETFTANDTTDELTVTRDFATGEKVRLRTSGTLPAPLAILTDYFVIRISATLIKLATNRTNADNGVAIDITDTGTGTHDIDLYSVYGTAYQQESRTSVVVGQSDGVTGFQEFELPDELVLPDTISVVINSVVYTAVTSFIDSIATDKHFKVLNLSDGRKSLQFGNNTYGMIPPVFDIEVSYAFGGGANSNITVIGRINSYGGTNSDIVAVENTIAFSGGAEEQGIEEAKILGPLLLRAQDRFVTTTDGRAQSLNFAGVALVKVNRLAFGNLSAQVLVVPNGGGLPNATLKSDLQTFLIDRTILESIDVRVQDPDFVTVSPTSSFKVKTGFSFATVKPFYDLGWLLLLDETGQEIKDDFDANGVQSATTLINTIHSTSFSTSTELDQIQRLLENLTPVDFNLTIQSSDVIGYLDSFVNGVDYLTISSPSFPIALTSNQITTVGTITTTEIP